MKMKNYILIGVIVIVVIITIFFIYQNNTPSFQPVENSGSLCFQKDKNNKVTSTEDNLGDDMIALPPIYRKFFSLNRNYLFVLCSPDSWKWTKGETVKAVAELFQINTESKGELLWTQLLPHSYGPRYVVVGNKGQILLLDEWINVASRYAVMILNRENQLVAQHDFETVESILGVPGAKIVEMAKYGAWITSPPVLDPSNESVSVKTAGKVLIIRLNDGHLSVEESPQNTLPTKQTPQTNTTKISCNNLENQINKMLDEANYCNTVSDCLVDEWRYACPFGCYKLFNKNADLSLIDEKVNIFFDNKCKLCENLCPTPPEANDVKCINNKCVNIRFQ